MIDLEHIAMENTQNEADKQNKMNKELVSYGTT